MVELELLS